MDLLHGFGPTFITGVEVTLQIAVLSVIISLPLGLVGALGRLSSNRILSWAITAYINFIRGVPELLVILVFYFGASMVLSKIFDRYIEVNPFTAGACSLAAIYVAYFTECFRGAILAIPKGQIEAGLAHGMSGIQIFRRITLPQLWRFALPGVANLWLVLLKDTSLVSIVGLEEIMRKARIGAEYSKQPFTFYLVAALLYLGLTLISQFAFQWSTRRSQRGYAQVNT